jgi:DNA-dependent RNA polymerase auxiliary subunit epsilon
MARPEPYICWRIWQISDKMSEYQNVPNRMPERQYMSIRIYVRQNASQNVRIYVSYKNYNVLYGKLFHDVSSLFFDSTFLGLEF